MSSEEHEEVLLSEDVLQMLNELRTDNEGRKSYNGKIKEMLEVYKKLFIPCLITIERDPDVFGRPKFDYVVHRWNDGDDHINKEYVKEVETVPVPLSTVAMMESFTDDFYDPSEPWFCEVCFPEQEPNIDHHNP